MLSNVIAVANGKGGVGKTALTANVAGALAAADNEVLAVDLDLQGNLELDLGYRDGRSDEGRALTAALENRSPLTSPGIAAVRPRLDVVPGGGALARVTERCEPDALTAALSDLYWKYHVVLLDCPPAAPMMGLAFRTARWVLVPVRADAKSIQGLEVAAHQFAEARETNPELRLLGVVTFAVPRSAKRIRRQLHARLEELLGGVAPVFATGIRDAPRAAWDTAEWGQLATDYEAMYRTKGVSVAARGLASDYHQVAIEIVERLAGFSPPEPDPETSAKQEPDAKPKPKAKAKAAGEAVADASVPRTGPDHEPAPTIIRTATRLPRSLANRVRSAARAQNVGRARLLLIAYVEHEDDLLQLLNPEPVKPRDHKYVSVGLQPDQPDTEPTEMVTWELPALGMARLNETTQQHGVTRTALIRAVLEAAYSER